MKAVVAAFNQEKALVGAFSVIIQPVVEPMDRFAALVTIYGDHWPAAAERSGGGCVHYGQAAIIQPPY